MSKQKTTSKSFRLGLELLEGRRLCAVDLALIADAPAVETAYFASSHRFHNTSKPADVDGDGSVSPIDALRLIDTLNRRGSMNLGAFQASQNASGAEGESDPIGNVDTNNDGSLSPIDVLVVIDSLNATTGSDDAPVPMLLGSFGYDSVIDPQLELEKLDSVCNTMLLSENSVDTPHEISDSTDTEVKPRLSDCELPIIEEEFDSIFEDPNFDIGWVKRTNVNDEMPVMFFDDELIFNENLPSDAMDFLPVYSTFSPVAGSGVGMGTGVALFSQQGLFAKVVRQNAQENTSVEASPVMYFSSNFLRGIR
jgi:hypothetical protein